jgi:hypothetical protein
MDQKRKGAVMAKKAKKKVEKLSEAEMAEKKAERAERARKTREARKTERAAALAKKLEGFRRVDDETGRKSLTYFERAEKIISESQYGRVTNLEWCQHECERIGRQGSKVEIVVRESDSFIALSR